MGPKKGPGESAEARTKGNRTLVLYHEKTEKSNQGRKDNGTKEMPPLRPYHDTDVHK